MIGFKLIITTTTPLVTRRNVQSQRVVGDSGGMNKTLHEIREAVNQTHFRGRLSAAKKERGET